METRTAAEGVTMKRPKDVNEAELAAARAIILALDKLNQAELHRVIRWMQRLYLKEPAMDIEWG